MKIGCYDVKSEHFFCLKVTCGLRSFYERNLVINHAGEDLNIGARITTRAYCIHHNFSMCIFRGHGKNVLNELRAQNLTPNGCKNCVA